MAAAVLLGYVSAPHARLVLGASPADGTIPGAFHVHTNRSDGRGSPSDVAAAAARAGLRFVILTDHGDATRAPDPPTYRSGVLCLDGVEISTNGGHYIAVDMPASPYPLGGEVRAVVEDVERLGGFGVIAHPVSPRSELKWNDWNLTVDAMELVNLDTSWRLRLRRPGFQSRLELLGALFAYPFRGEESIANLLATAPESFDRYQSLAARDHVVALAGADGHASLGLRGADPGVGRYSLPFPGYETVFRTMSLRVEPAAPLSGDPAADAVILVDSIRAGRVYTVVDGLASPPSFSFTASRGNEMVGAGEELLDGDAFTLHVRSNAPQTFTTRIWKDLRVLAAGNRDGQLSVVASGPGVYRAEIRAADRPGAPLWILSNPIYVRGADVVAEAPTTSAVDVRRFDGQSLWRTETDATSLVAFDPLPDPSESGGVITFSLGGGAPRGQFAAIALDTSAGLDPFDHLVFTARADQPMRVSVQVRAAVDPSSDDRWQRSVFVDATEREYLVPLREMTPVGETTSREPPLDRLHSVLFVVELTNTRPGSEGQIWLRRVRAQR